MSIRGYEMGTSIPSGDSEWEHQYLVETRIVIDRYSENKFSSCFPTIEGTEFGDIFHDIGTAHSKLPFLVFWLLCYNT